MYDYFNVLIPAATHGHSSRVLVETHAQSISGVSNSAIGLTCLACHKPLATDGFVFSLQQLRGVARN